MNKYNRPIVETFHLKKDYETPSGMLPILKGVELEVFPEDMTFVIGKSGSGKSTLLHLMGGLDYPTSGKILFEGSDLSDMNEKALARFRNQNVGFIFQSYHLLPELTLFENVLLPSMIAGNADKKWAKEILKRVKLLSRKDHHPSELSGGEKQRAAIARALINRPSLVFCDEPTGNLDEETAESIYALIKDLNEQDGQAFMIVTHDESWAWRYPKVLRLHDGVLIQEKRGQIHQERAE